jgi:hypothetical protein
MTRKFTQSLMSFILVFSLGFFINSTEINAQNCTTPTGISTSNLSNFTATANWNLDSNVHRYRVRHQELGAQSWNNIYNIFSASVDITNLLQNTYIVWQVKAYCSSGSTPNSAWSVLDTFLTTSYPVDCYNTPNGSAFIDSCGNCVGGLTGASACIPFSPSVAISLSTLECNTLADITFITSQDPNEPDISSTVFSSDAGYFNFTGLSTNDTIGSGVIIAGGGYINVNAILLVDFIINADKISVKTVDNITGSVYGSFTIENVGGGILVVATSPGDNNNVTNGNSQLTLLEGLFTNPNPSALTFTSTITSELGHIDSQSITETIACTDCNNDFGGGAFVDSCGNCVGGNTGAAACIDFTPTVSVSLSNTDCDSLTDLTINVSQDPNEPDMSTSLFVSNSGSFTISTMNIGDTIGTAVMTFGSNTFNTDLFVSSIISVNQAIVQAKDVNTGLVLGTFTISNSNPGVSIIANSVPDGNNVTNGNSQSITFIGVFLNPTQGTLVFTSTINSETGDVDVQSFPFSIVCLCVPNTSTTSISACDSYTWNGVTYTSSGSYTFLTTNVGGCDSIATLVLTIDNSTSASMSASACDTYTWSVDGNVYTASGTYTSVSTNAAGCTHVDSLVLTIGNSTSASMSATACDTYTWSVNGQVYTTSGTYVDSSINASGCLHVESLVLTIDNNTSASMSATACDTYTWSVDGQVYTSSGTYTSVSTNAAGCTHTDSLVLTIDNSTTSLTVVTATNTYTWNGITYTSSGVYTYSTTNSIGCDSIATLDLTINTCDVPVNLATAPLLDRATMSWDAVSGVDHYEIRFKDASDSIWIVMTPIYGTSQTKYSLTSSTAYQWQIRTLCDASSTISSAWSDTVNFNTLTPCTTPTGASTVIENLTSATIQVDSIGAFAYDFRVKKTTDSWGQWVYHSSSSNVLTVLGLDNSTDYHWQARNICNAGGINNSGFTPYNYFTTLTPCADPTALTVDSTEITAATLSWAGVGADHYLIKYRVSGATAWDSSTTTNTNIVLTGLNSLTTYNWELVAYCEADGRNNSSSVAGADFTTQNPCTTPNGLGISLALLNKLTFTWNAQAPAHHYDLRLRAVGDTTWIILTPIYTNSQTKSNLTPGTAYEWQVRSVCDPSGISMSDWSVLTVSSTLSPCSAPTNPTASAIHLTTATLNWDASSGAFQYDVRFKEVGSSWGSWVYTSTTDLFLVQTGLNPNTSYQWQVRTNCDVNGNNYSAWVTNQVVTTMAPCSTPTSLLVTSTTLTTAEVAIGGSNTTNHYIVIHREVGTTLWDTTVIVSGLINAGYAPLTFSGLQAGTTYEWQVAAACLSDGSNTSAFTAGPNFTTDTPCAIPNNLVSSVSGNSVILNWDAVSGADHYSLRYRIVGDSIWNTYGNITTTTFTRNGLDFDTQYEWQVSTSCNSNTYNSSSFSASATFVTDGCTEPTNLYTDLIGTDRATMNWDATATAHHYDIRMREAGTTGWAVNITFIFATSQTKFGLTDGTTYEWQLRAVCSSDTSSVSNWSATQSFTTLANCTQKPTNLNTTNITLTSATLNWDAAANAIGYIIRHKEMVGSWGSWVYDTVYTTTLNKTGLTPNTEYDWRALSFCDSNMTNISGWENSGQYITDEICSSPSNIGVEFTALDAATLYWDVDTDVNSYTLIFREVGAANWDTVTVTTANSTVYSAVIYYVLNGLSNTTTYEWELIANCSASYNNSTSAIAGPNFNTLTPCAMPINMTTSNVDVFNATLNWSPVSGIDHYEVRYALDGSSNWSSIVVAGTDSSVNIGGLISDTSYQWQVMASCQASGINNTAWTSSTVFSTAVCDVPTNLSTSNILTDRASMNWLANGSHHYNIRFRPQGGATWLNINFVYGNTFTKYNLNPGVTYEWEIQSMCAQTMVASPPWSAAQSFTTWEDCSASPNITSTTNITLTSADINWNATINALGYIVRFKENASSWGSWVYDTLSVTSVSKTSLIPNTAYQWQVRAYCNVEVTNLSQWSTNVNFITLANCGDPTNLSVPGNTLGINSATLNWKGTSGADHYEIPFKEVGVATWDTIIIVGTTVYYMPSGMTGTASSSGPNMSLEINGLSGGITYQWQVMTACDPGGINNSAFVSGTNFNTNDPCSLPNNFFASNIEINKATMNWTSTSSSIHHYNIQMREAGSSVWNIQITNIPSNATSQTKHNLTPGTSYEWQIQSACAPGNSALSAWSSTETFTTIVVCDTKPSNSGASNITLTTADLGWDVVANAQAYEMRFKLLGSSWGSWVYETFIQNSITKSGLATGTYYEWQVRSVCDTANSITSGWANSVVFTTLTTCADPTSLQVGSSNLTNNSAILYWLGTYGADGYVINYRESGSSSWITIPVANTFSGSAGNYTITGLSPNTTYEWQISTDCNAGGINSSSVVNGPDFTTTLACIVPTGMNTTNVLLDRATMNWAPTSNAHHYDVRLRQSGGAWIDLFYISTASITKYNLLSGTSYEWKVRGACTTDSSDVSAWTSLQIFTTLSPCTKPQNTVVTSITTTTATLGWDVVGAATAYDVRFKLQLSSWGSWEYTFGVNVDSLFKDSLSVGTSYHWQVRAVCGSTANMSGFTSYNTFSTLSGSRITAGDVDLAVNLNVYPNPTRGLFNINFISEELDNFEVLIVDAFGKLIIQENKKDFIGEYAKQVDLSEYPRGIYMVQIKTENSFVSKRIVLQ